MLNAPTMHLQLITPSVINWKFCIGQVRESELKKSVQQSKNIGNSAVCFGSFHNEHNAKHFY